MNSFAGFFPEDSGGGEYTSKDRENMFFYIGQIAMQRATINAAAEL